MLNQEKDLVASVISSPNIALVKYWGKYHEQLILPINDSIGITLNPEDLSTNTTITFSKNIQADLLILNGVQQPISKRLVKMLQKVRDRGVTTIKSIPKQKWNQHHFRIQSTNSFPTASGMASSASGLASIAVCLNKLFEKCFTQKQVSQLARLGSGSASRSIFGGLVRWKGLESYPIGQLQGDQLLKLSHRCISEQILPKQNLEDLRVIILLAHENKKQTSSTEGMKRSIQTSELIKFRNQIAKERIQKIVQSLKKGDINTFSQTIIKDSNTFHAICLDTYPPIHYLTDFSKQVMSIIDHSLNPILDPKIAYTFDAGAHAFVIVHKKVFNKVFRFFLELYKINQDQLNQKGLVFKKNVENQQNEIEIPKLEIINPVKMWVTDVGYGPIDKSNDI